MEGTGQGTGVPAASVSAGPAPAASGSRDRTKTPSFLSNLGKPTLRGIRKCPKCGMYNGTRGLSCKNKACGAVFRDGARKAQAGAEAVRVVTGADGGAAGGGEAQVFSVRQRGRGPEQRGFVELGVTETAISTADGTLLTHISLGHCFVPSCRQGSAPGRGAPLAAQPAPPPQQERPCLHMKQAMECQAEATPLTLKSSVLGSLQAPAETKQALWQLATESLGPLVQRLSRAVMVVKCQRSARHPLGLLHLTLGERKEGLRYHCACQRAARPEGASRTALKLPEDPSSSSSSPALADASSSGSQEYCLHLYACVCAFASDEKLAAEFSGFFSYDADGLHVGAECSVTNATAPPQPAERCTPHKPKRSKLEDSMAASIPTLPAKEGVSSSLRRFTSRKHPISTVLKKPGGAQPVDDEARVSLPFQHWLASVTERIHQTMHFQFGGKPDPLVFHIPQSFFNALQQRLSAGSKKKRLPNSTTGASFLYCFTPRPRDSGQYQFVLKVNADSFVRKDALPLGTFSKYTWHITNILHVKQIFDTPEMPLEVTQSFVRNRDGSFEPFRCPEVPVEPETQSRADRQPSIRPLELRTFLRVGNTSAEQKDPTPFVIEWIPDILPKSKIGELRIRFEYGHLHNGHVEYSDSQGGPAPVEICRVTVP